MPDSESDLPRDGTPPDDQSRKDVPPESTPPTPPGDSSSSEQIGHGANAGSTPDQETPRGNAPAEHPSTEIAPAAPEVFPGFMKDVSDADDNDDSQPPRRRQLRKPARAEMGFLEHLEELRMTVVKSAMAAVCGMVIVGFFFKKFFALLGLPLAWALAGTDIHPKFPTQLLGPAQNWALVDTSSSPLNLISTSPFEVFALIIQVSVFGGIILMSPLIVYFVVRFIAPGLTWKEKGMLRPALIAASILFFMGALACFFLILPIGLKIAYITTSDLGIILIPNAKSYYSLVVWSVIGAGLLFEFPLILVILQVLGIIESDTLRRTRRYAIVIILVVGALIAPSPDPGSMLMMAVPMYGMFEGSIVVGSILRRRRLAAEARAAQTTAG